MLNTVKKVVAILLLVAFSATVFGPLAAHAQQQPKEQDQSAGIFGITLVQVLYYVFIATNTFISWLAQLLHNFLYFEIPSGSVVEVMWKIVRDFANMLFILVLIIIALATIFNVRAFGIAGYDINTERLLARFLIVALLLNFSLVIGGLILRGAQIVSDTFLYNIGDVGSAIGSRIDLWKLLALKPGQLDELQRSYIGSLVWGNLLQSTVLQFTFTTLIGIIIAFSLAVAVVVTFLRIPVLITLLIFAPIAWLFGVLPMTRNLSEKWWRAFWGWSLFLPFFLFILYFGLYFLGQLNTAISTISRTPSTAAIAGVGFTLQSIFLYLITAFIFTGGTLAAMQASFFAGSGVTAIASKVRGRLLGATYFGPYRGAAGLAARVPAGAAAGLIAGAAEGKGLGKITGAVRGAITGAFGSKQVTEGLKKGIAQAFGEARREGVLGIGGTRKAEQLGAAAGQLVGGRGMVERKLQEDVTDYKKAYREHNFNTAQLRGIIASARSSNPQKLAAYEMLKDKKALGGEDLFRAYTLYGGGKSLSGAEFGLDIEFDKLSRGERASWYGDADNDEVKKKIAKVMADEGEFANRAALEGAAKLFPTEMQQVDFLRRVGKKQLVDALRAAENLKILKDKTGAAVTFEKALGDEVVKLKGEGLLSIVPQDLLAPTDPVKSVDYEKLRSALEKALANESVRQSVFRSRDLTPQKAEILTTLLPVSGTKH